MNSADLNSNLQDLPEKYIEWNEKFALGITRIDEQHETLVKLCNDLYLTLLQNKEDDNWRTHVKESLRICATYTQTHFKDEETLMEACKFPGLEHHRAEHIEFTKKVLNLTNNFESITIIDAFKFTRFLYDWILSHIALEDRLYVPTLSAYLQKQRH